VSIEVQPFFDRATSTFTYLVYRPGSKDAVILDPVLAFDPASGEVGDEPLRPLEAALEARGLRLCLILETHAHADHLSGASVLRARHPGAEIGIGRRITEVQATFKALFELPEEVPADGRPFDRLLDDGETVHAGSIEIEERATPGHTPACMSYRIEDTIFTGDALFLPDVGTGRCDFPGGSAEALYDAITQKIYTLPDATRVFVGHDYPPDGREVRWASTVGEEKARNRHLPAGRAREDFVRMRRERDATLAPPRLLYPSLQVNIAAGRLPPFLKIPVRPSPAVAVASAPA
jgi:glyoxylase-like metal-dependent hydrolase (beta-lactamase superfamily II)